MNCKPITPQEIAEQKGKVIPSEVFESFNELIVKRYCNGKAIMAQDEVVSLILAKRPNNTRSEIFNEGWLDVESVYEGAGWTVDYDKPGYNESYPAVFTFHAKAAR